MNKEDAQKRIPVLNALIARHDRLYYRDAAPEISDREYDALYDELKELEKEFPDLISEDSATGRVGSDLDNSLPEIEHSIPVLSLDKAYSAEDIEAWLQRMEKICGDRPPVSAEEKIDGSSIVLYYISGKLHRAVTRGNGRVGNDVTANVRTIRSVPLILTENTDIVVRGEIFISREDFEQYNRKAGGVYANPRNLAAGTLRSVRSASAARVPLDVFIYEGFQENGPQSHKEMLQYLNHLGFKTNPGTVFFDDNCTDRTVPSLKHSELAGYLRDYSIKRGDLPYEIDGLVFKADSTAVREQLGYTAHHPRWAIAFKFESPQAETVLNSITLQIGRNGRATPVAELEPVPLAGSVISRATLHNMDYIRQLEIAPGDRVAISKRGDVIPAVEQVVEKGAGRAWTMPLSCPECATELVRDGAHHFCPNRDCPARQRGRLIHFCGKQGLDIDGLGEKTVRFLHERFHLTSPEEFFSFDYSVLVSEDGFGEKKVALIREGLNRAGSRPLAALLAAAGIEGLGRRSAEALISGGFRSLEKILDTAAAGDWESFASVEGFAELLARQMVEEFSLPDNVRMFRKLAVHGLKVVAEKQQKTDTGLFINQVWCVTGSFDNFKPRDKAKNLIREQGGRIAESVSGKTTHLLAGEKAGSKLKKAMELGVEVVREEQFLKMLED